MQILNNLDAKSGRHIKLRSILHGYGGDKWKMTKGKRDDMSHNMLMSQRVTHMIQRSLTLVKHMGHVNPVKGNIVEGNPNKLARRGHMIGSGNRLPYQTTMHESGGDKWKRSIG
jgi:hypothetical protein